MQCDRCDHPHPHQHCDKCGQRLPHQPWEDGLVECLANVIDQRDSLIQRSRERLAKGHNDTCSHELGPQYACSCGHDGLGEFIEQLENMGVA